MNKVFNPVKLNGFRVICNPEGELQGRWPDPEQVEGEEKPQQMYTMAQQSNELGIPAVQIELPRSLR